MNEMDKIQCLRGRNPIIGRRNLDGHSKGKWC